jgi:hypothetical protein
MHENLRLTGKLNSFEMAGALCASLTFHVLLVLILASTSVYYPATGTETRFDVIWATPSALPREPAVTAEVKPLRNSAGLHRETATLEPQLLQDSSTQASRPQSSGAEGKVDQAAREHFQDLDVLMVSAKMPAASQTAPATVKTVATSRRDLTQKKDPVPVRHPQRPPQATGIVPEQQPLPAANLASPARNDTKLLTELQDEPEPIPQKKPIQFDIPRAKKEPEFQAPEGNDLVVARVQITRDGDDGDRQPARGSELNATLTEAKGAKPSSEPAVRPPERKIPEPLTALARQENAAAKSSGDQKLPAQQLARAGTRARDIAHLTEPPRPATEQYPQVRQRAAAIWQDSPAVAQRAARPAPATAAPPPAGRPGSGGEPQPSGKREHRDDALSQSAPNSQNAASSESAAKHQSAASSQSASKPQTTAKPAEKPQQTRGLVLAALHGDLKLVMTGDTGIKVTVKFRDYPKSRRNRVLTRFEVRREQTVTPLLAAPREDTREAVIQTAREGIYLFSAEPAGSRSVRATFTLKVFESGARERTAPLGNRSLSGPTVLVKILMPEAILWDDESAFTGSMEDSESETKFNATTGLYWKEFRD